MILVNKRYLSIGLARSYVSFRNREELSFNLISTNSQFVRTDFILIHFFIIQGVAHEVLQSDSTQTIDNIQ